MSDDRNADINGPDEPERRDHADFVESVANTLDVDAGLADAIDIAGYKATSGRLAQLLNLQQGLATALAAVVPAQADTDNIAAGQRLAAARGAQGLPEGRRVPVFPSRTSSWATHLARLLTALDAPARLNLRVNPRYTQLSKSITLTIELQPVLDVDRHNTRVLEPDTHTLARDLNLDTHSRDLARALAHELARDLDHYGDRFRLESGRATRVLGAPALDIDIARAEADHLVRDLDPDRPIRTGYLEGFLSRTRYLDRVLTRTGYLDRAHARAHDLALDLARAARLVRDVDLARDLTRTRYLARDLVLLIALSRYLTYDSAHNFAGARARALALERARTLAGDLTLVRSRADALVRELGLGSLVSEPLRTFDELHRLHEVLDHLMSSFVGADLRSASLPPLGSLEGVRWSITTQWPAEREEEIRAVSVEVRPGLFEVTGQAQRNSEVPIGTS